MVAANTRRADSVIDVTDDAIGVSTIHYLNDLKAARRAEIDFRIGAYSPLGFRDDEPRRWELLTAGALESDFIGSLPERDDVIDTPNT